jgi:hypothetical protein
MRSQLSTHPSDLTNLDTSPKIALESTPRETKVDPPLEVNPPFDPLSAPSNIGMYPISSQGNLVDWDMQDLVWSNLPWDWNLMGDTKTEGINEGGWVNVAQGEEQMNGDLRSETMGMPVL